MSPETGLHCFPVETYGVDSVHGRQVLLVELTDAWQWDDPAREPFVLFIAADASRTSDHEIERYARASIAAGTRYICSWGPDCERVHDAFDRVLVEPEVASGRSGSMTTWHDGDSLAEAIVYAVFDTHFDPEDGEPYFGGSAVILAVQQPWLSEVRALLGDADALDRLFRGEVIP